MIRSFEELAARAKQFKSVNGRKRRGRPSPAPNAKHGTLAGYTWGRCRCTRCRNVMTIYQRAYHLRRKAEGTR